MAENNQNVLNEELDEDKKNSGNTGLPFGLCKKFGVPLSKDATPREAWEALKGVGITPEQGYEMAKKGVENVTNEEIERLKKIYTTTEEPTTHVPEEKPKRKSYSEFMKEMRDKDMRKFFGDDIHYVSNKYFTFKRVIDKDNILIVTDNLRDWKDGKVLVVDSNKVVFLKPWQYRKVHNYDNMINSYAVKLNRNYFKTYTVGFNYDNISFSKEDTFDELYDTAKAQDKQNLKFANGWM